MPICLLPLAMLLLSVQWLLRLLTYGAITLLVLTASGCQPIADTRDPITAAATQTVRASQPLPPLPHTIKVWVLPQPTVSLLPTVTPTPEGK